MEIGTKIRKIRELKNFSQEYMARQLNMNQSTYSRLEKEEADPTLTQLDQIAKILDVKLEELLNFNEKYIFNNYAPNNNNLNQNCNINTVTPEERELYQKHLLTLEKENDYLKQLVDKLTGALGK